MSAMPPIVTMTKPSTSASTHERAPASDTIAGPNASAMMLRMRRNKEEEAHATRHTSDLATSTPIAYAFYVQVLERDRRCFILICVSCFVFFGCASEPPPKAPPAKQQEVPANSLDDARLHGDPKTKDQGSTKEDPTHPLTTKVGDASSSSSSSSSSSDPSPSGRGGTAKNAGTTAKGGAAGAGGVVSKGECDRVMDKYLDLEISKNPSLKGVPPEVIDQAKQMAREKHGDAPCSATRAQYTCAMAATSTAAWQKCMK
jgi:hypothetical protein